MITKGEAILTEEEKRIYDKINKEELFLYGDKIRMKSDIKLTDRNGNKIEVYSVPPECIYDRY